MLLAYLVAIIVNMVIITLGVKLGCKLIGAEQPWIGALLIGGITTLASIIPYIGLFAGIIALLICLSMIANLDLWPESILVTIVIKALSIAATLGMMAAMR
ncbi:MAG TPA: hypothetical protein VEL07_12270 [Planctomycetota bacterium]|nr:hypothetical protein [Planctomycetota bacterium]